jgi:asparagine synthase (glutamine-hydrolysing)
MPAIAGIISKGRGEENRRDLSAMMASLRYDPDFRSGEFVQEEAGLYAGWTCHAGSAADCMPVTNETRDLALLISGETHPDPEVIDELLRRGHRFDRDDESYLIHLYEERGRAFVEDLNGTFAIVLLDRARNEILLLNDRFGMGRIYVSRSRDEFLFSTEAKGLLKIRPAHRSLDPEGLAQFLVCDCPLGERTLFKGIEILPPGSIRSFRHGVPAGAKKYFDVAEWEQQPVLENGIFLNELLEMFHRILPRHFRARQPLALSLTSGLDSRAILAHADERFGDIPCFTFGGMDRESYDVRIARTIASRTRRSFRVVNLERGFFSDFTKHAAQTVYISDGYHDVCGSHDVVLNREARQIAPIRMTGKFGSEVIGRHSMMRKPRDWGQGLLHPDIEPLVGRAADELREIRQTHPLTFTAFCEIPWHEFGRLAIESSALTLRTPYMDNDLVKLMYRLPRDFQSALDTRLALADDGRGLLQEVRTDRGTAGRSIPLVSGLLRFLLYALFKGEYIYLCDLPHWMARLDAGLRPLAPERLLAGRYQMMYYRLWFRDELADAVKGILLEPRAAARFYLERGAADRIVRGHVEGRANHTAAINKLMTLELIQSLLIEERQGYVHG